LVEYFPRNRSGYYKFKVLTRLGEIIKDGQFTIPVGKFFSGDKSHVKFHAEEVFTGEVASVTIVLKGKH
jgi:hypothetical protein